MKLLLLALLFTHGVATTPADTLPAQSAPPPSGPAYLDSEAARLVVAGRARRTQVEGGVQRYQHLARSRVSVGVTALRRERMLYRCDSALRIDWQRGEPVRVEVLGGREVIPIVSRRVRPKADECAGDIFDPSEDRLSFGGMMRGDSGYVRHPLADESEADYRFASGDVTTIRLPDGQQVRLHELRVIPRRADSRLVSGSLWLEASTHAVVRAVLRLARPFDLELDAGEDADDVPRLLRPIRADLRYLTIEYGLWEGRWWLPRLIAYEGEAQVGSLLDVPVRVEQSYTEYRVWADPADGPVLERLEPPQECTPARADRSEEPGTEDDDREDGESADPDSVAAPRRGVTIRADRDGVEVDARLRPACRCSGGRCYLIERVVPEETELLLVSEHLPESIFAEGEDFLTERDLEELTEALRIAVPAPWQLSPPRTRWGLQGLDLIRFNRVEGLSLGARVDLELGPAALDLTGRLGTGDLVPELELGIERSTVDGRHRFALYQRLEVVEPDNRALGLGNSLGALLLGRDDGLYYRSIGAEARLRSARPPGAGGLTARLFAEHHRATGEIVDWSLPRLWRDSVFQPNLVAEETVEVGAELDWRGQWGLDPSRPRLAGQLFVRGVSGRAHYVQPVIGVNGAIPLGPRLTAGLDLRGGTSFGAVPVQRLWYLGGAGTVRGYDAAASAGDSFWYTRAELARGAPAVRLVAFLDAGWAGDAEDARLNPPLLAVGGGISFLDGLVRADLARGLREGRWRLDLHFDAGL